MGNLTETPKHVWMMMRLMKEFVPLSFKVVPFVVAPRSRVPVTLLVSAKDFRQEAVWDLTQLPDACADTAVPKNMVSFHLVLT
jgi:hypothetical protein